MVSSSDVYIPTKKIAFREILQHMVLVDPIANRLIRLNETASFIWGLLDGRTVEDIAGEVENEFEISSEQALQDAKEFIELIRARDLVAKHD